MFKKVKKWPKFIKKPSKTGKKHQKTP